MVKITELIPSIGSLNEVIDLQKDPTKFIVRESDELVLISYKRGVTDMNDEYAHLLRGLILSKDTLEVVFYGLNKGIDYTEFSNSNAIEDITIEESIDGTLLNLYNYNSVWYISTKTIINAADSKYYSNRSFLDLFMDAKKNYDFNLESLNKELCYSFVLKHPDNRIVTKYSKAELVHINTRCLKTLKLVDCNLGIPRPKSHLDIRSYDELNDLINKMVYNNEGFMLREKNNPENRCKVKGKAYLDIKELRGNHNNSMYRILELRKENDTIKYNKYFKFYPEFKKDSHFISIKIKSLIDCLLVYYNMVKKEKDKEFVEIPAHIKMPLYEIHEFYKQLLTDWNNKVDKDKYRRPSINYRGIHIYFLKLPVIRQYNLLKRHVEWEISLSLLSD